MPQDIVRSLVHQALEGALHQAHDRGDLKTDPFPIVTLDPPKRPEWGDFASSVALALAKAERRKPLDVANIILGYMSQQSEIFDKVEIAPPGFLNMTIKQEYWLKVLFEIEEQGERYGWSDVGNGKKILLEFVSANPTGPLHVGHGRGAALGEAIARILLVTGHDVSREYYVNDAGRQMKHLGASVWARYQERCGRTISFPQDGYQGAYLKEVAAHIQDKVQDAWLQLPPEEAAHKAQEFARRELLGRIQEDLKSFGICFDTWFSEAELLKTGAVGHAISDLKDRNLLEEEDGALWFRTSQFGDEKDRVVQKQDGDLTYLASDIAYHRDKLVRGFDLLIDIWGADHHGYIPRIEAVMEAYGHPKDRLKVVLVQMVSLMRGGKKIEMSKRTGEFITLREIMDEVGADAAKFFFLMRRADTHFDFDLELAKQQSADNPVYYVQYAHARVASICRVAKERHIPIPKVGEADLTTLSHSDDLAFIRKLSAYPSTLLGSVMALEPHRITFYLQELARVLHNYYFKHRILPSMPEDVPESMDFGQDQSQEVPLTREQPTPAQTAARLVLMCQAQQVIRNGLHVLGVTAPEKM